MTFSLDRDTVRSTTPPDTLTATVRAEDPDGVDSVWVTVDSVAAGEDGSLDRVFTAQFRFPIGAGKSAGTHVPVQLRARDGAGFQATRDSFVVVVP
jgi:hypothetical protein